MRRFFILYSRSAGKQIYLTLASLFFVAAVASFVWRGGNILMAGPKFFELLIIPTAGFLLTAFFRKEIPAPPSSFFRLAYRAMALLGFLFFFIVVGHISSINHFPEWETYKTQVLLEYGRILFVFFFFFLVFYFGTVKPLIAGYSLYAIALSPLVLWSALVPSLRNAFVLVTDNRLRVPGSDPNYLAAWITLSVLIAISFFIYHKGRTRWLGFTGIILLTPLLLWTGSRSAVVAGIVAGMILGGTYLRNHFSSSRIRNVLLVLIAFVCAFFLSYLVIPVPSREAFLYRSTEVLERVIEKEPTIEKSTDRIELLRLGTDQFRVSPLGLGPAYWNWKPVKTLPDGYKLGPHNLFLEVGLTAGYGGLAVWLAILFLFARRSLRLLRQDDFVSVSLAVCFVSILVTSFFLDTFTLRPLWLMMGFIGACALFSHHSLPQREG